MYNVKIPYSISKLEFYSIADSYKCFYLSNILLIHNNNVLKKDESSIDDINNYDTIFIIENRNYPDDSYYYYLQNKYQNCLKRNIVFYYNEKKYNMVIPLDASLSEMLNAFNLRYGLCDNYFLFNGEILNQEDEIKISEIFINDYLKVLSLKNKTEVTFKILGKPIFGKLLINGKNIKVQVGTLNSTQFLFSLNAFGSYKNNLKKIILGKTLIKCTDETCLHLLGINNDFDCILE